MFETFNDLKAGLDPRDSFPDLFDLPFFEIAQKFSVHSKVLNLFGVEAGNTGTGRVHCHWIVSEDKDAAGFGLALDRSVAFHPDNPISNYKMGPDRTVNIQYAFLDSMPVKKILGPAIFHTRNNAKHIFHRKRHASPMVGLNFWHRHQEISAQYTFRNVKGVDAHKVAQQSYSLGIVQIEIDKGRFS